MPTEDKILRVISIEVWGNAKDGWEQNDYHTIARITVKQWPRSKAELFAMLRSAEILAPRVRHDAYRNVLENQSTVKRWELERNRDGKPFLIIEGLENGKPVY
jgi:hypothetical protein